MTRVDELFPNLVFAHTVAPEDREQAAPSEEDPEAHYEGAPFTETEDEDEWMTWSNFAM